MGEHVEDLEHLYDIRVAGTSAPEDFGDVCKSSAYMRVAVAERADVISAAHSGQSTFDSWFANHGSQARKDWYAAQSSAWKAALCGRYASFS